jgi:uncharacterized membrane protein YdjX (TVP38/TMEM64 family)
MVFSIWPGEISFVMEFMRQIMLTLSFVGLFLVMIIQSIIAPIPAEALIIIAAGVFGWFPTFIIGTAGMMVGAVINYLISLKAGRPIVEKLTSPQTLSRVQDYVSRYGVISILFLRLLPFISFDAVSYLAGLAKIEFLPFISLTFLGLLFRVFLFTQIGEVLLGQFNVDFIQFVALACATLIAAFFLGRIVLYYYKKRTLKKE